MLSQRFRFMLESFYRTHAHETTPLFRSYAIRAKARRSGCSHRFRCRLEQGLSALEDCGHNVLVQDLLKQDYRAEERKVIPFGKARKLGDVVEPNVDQPLGPRVFEPSEERLCRLFCETNGKNLHSAALLTALGSGA